MIELLVSILVFVLAAAGLGLGVLRGRRGIQGSCGGLNDIPGITPDCDGRCRRTCHRQHKQQSGGKAASQSVQSPA